MKKKIIISISVVLLCAVFSAALYCVRKTDIFGHTARVSSKELKFDGNEIPDIDRLIEELGDFYLLKKVDLGSFPVYTNQVEKLENSRPNVEFIYTPCVYIYGKTVPTNTPCIDLSYAQISGTDELIKYLPEFSLLKKVKFGDNTLTEEEKTELEEKFPEIEFDVKATYKICGLQVREDSETLDLSDVSFDGGAVEDLAKFKCLKEVNFEGNEPDRETMISLVQKYPHIFFRWNIDVNGKNVLSDAETLDLTYMKITDYEELKQSVSLLGKLKYIDAGYSSLTNEQLEELRKLYPEIDVEWVIHMGKWSLRTDAVAFSVLIRDYSHKRLTTEDIQVLKYCTKLQALDIGHQAITDISVIGDYLTGLRVLILADNKISDLSPLSKLKHLHYLEFFVNRVTDLTPLSECTELVDLNISYNHGLSDISPILNLPLIERIWLEHIPVSKADVNLLRQTYPNAKIVSVGEGSVDNGWRYHKRYQAMRDMYDNNYMSEEFSKYDGTD